MAHASSRGDLSDMAEESPVSKGYLPVLNQVIFQLISQRLSTYRDFARPFQKIKLGGFSSEDLVNKEGQTFLHAACLHCNKLVLDLIFHNGLFEKLYEMPVRPGAESRQTGLAGLLPHQLDMAMEVNEMLEELHRWGASMTDVHRWARDGEMQRLKQARGRVRDHVNTKDNHDATPLYWACASGNSDVVHLLLDLGTDADFVTSWGDNILHLVNKLSSDSCCDVLNVIFRHISPARLAQMIEAPNISGKTPIDFLAVNNNTEALVQYARVVPHLALKPSTLIEAVRYGNLKFVQLVIERYSSRLSEQMEGDLRQRAMALAYEHGHEQIITYLTANTDNTTRQLDSGFSTGIEEYLPEEYPVPAASDTYYTHHSSRSLGSVTKRRGISPLGKAAFYGDDRWVKEILSNRRNLGRINERCAFNIKASCYKLNLSGRWLYVYFPRPYQACVEENMVQLQCEGDVERYHGIVLQQGEGTVPEQVEVPPDTLRRLLPPVDVDDSTALQIAIQRAGEYGRRQLAIDRRNPRRYVETVALLLRHGANTEIRDAYNLTAAHIAAIEGLPDMLRMLADAKADLHARDNRSWDVYQICMERGLNIYKLLQIPVQVSDEG